MIGERRRSHGVYHPLTSVGGQQGGIETPDQWRILFDFILEPIVQSWARRKLCFCLPREDAIELPLRFTLLIEREA